MLTNDEKDQLTELLMATYEMLGQSATVTAVNFMIKDLDQYSVDAINGAISRCRREVKSRFTLSEIIERIESDDGRLNANEAWAIACSIDDERTTAAVTPEILTALSVAQQCGDKIAGRMAFLECYNRLCQEARSKKEPVNWFMSMGTDKDQRAQAIGQAVTAGRIARTTANDLLPDLSDAKESMQNLITSTVKASSGNEYAKQCLSDLNAMFETPKIEQKKQRTIEEITQDLAAKKKRRAD